jgi:hypothetical protein
MRVIVFAILERPLRPAWTANFAVPVVRAEVVKLADTPS